MTKRDEAPAEYDGARDYVLLCVTALMLMLLALVQMRLGPWSLLPPLLGTVALLFRWRGGPVLVLAALLLLVASRAQGFDPFLLAARSVDLALDWLLRGPRFAPALPRSLPPRAPSPLAEALLALGTLAFCAGFYRLQSLHVRLFPPDPRRSPGEPNKRPGPHRRPAGQAALGEVLLLAVAAPVVTVLAEGFWLWLRKQETTLDLADSSWRGLLAVWLLGGGALAAAWLLRALAHRRLSRDEALLYLQDVVWRETRGEQRRLYRWLAWARERRRRREEKA